MQVHADRHLVASGGHARRRDGRASRVRTRVAMAGGLVDAARVAARGQVLAGLPARRAQAAHADRTAPCRSRRYAHRP